MNCETMFAEFAALIDKRLSDYINGVENAALRAAMEYSLFPAGKRFRPVLLLACAYEEGGKDAVEKALPFACAVEMIHTYSLIHDDLPAMDNDDYRRGKPACHKQFGEAEAILAGDALLTLALFPPDIAERDRAFMRPIAVAALEMVSGQYKDIQRNGNSNADDIYAQKTAALIRAAAVTGRMAVSEKDTAALEKAAHDFGMAFQYKDDAEDGRGVEISAAKALAEKYGSAALAGFEGIYGKESLPYKLVEKILYGV